MSHTHHNAQNEGAEGAVAVRRAALQDLQLIAENNAAMALETEGRALDPERVRLGVEAVLDDPQRGFYLLAEAEGAVAGQLMVTTEWSDWRNGWFWWIQSVFVAPGHRRRGVYRALHRFLEREAHARADVCGLRLYVDDENEGAMATYVAMGMDATRYTLFEVDFSGLARRA